MQDVIEKDDLAVELALDPDACRGDRHRGGLDGLLPDRGLGAGIGMRGRIARREGLGDRLVEGASVRPVADADAEAR